MTRDLEQEMVKQFIDMIDEAIDVRQAVNYAMRMGMLTSDISTNEGYGTDRVGDFIVNHIIEGDQDGNNENISLGMSTII